MFFFKAMQVRSVIASTAPKAQHDPQADWSRMVAIEGHWGQFWMALKEEGSEAITSSA